MLSKKQFGILLAMSICFSFFGGATMNWFLGAKVINATSDSKEDYLSVKYIKADHIQVKSIGMYDDSGPSWVSLNPEQGLSFTWGKGNITSSAIFSSGINIEKKTEGTVNRLTLNTDEIDLEEKGGLGGYESATLRGSGLYLRDENEDATFRRDGLSINQIMKFKDSTQKSTLRLNPDKLYLRNDEKKNVNDGVKDNYESVALNMVTGLELRSSNNGSEKNSTFGNDYIELQESGIEYQRPWFSLNRNRMLLDGTNMEIGNSVISLSAEGDTLIISAEEIGGWDYKTKTGRHAVFEK